jgi:hypothetical protein
MQVRPCPRALAKDASFMRAIFGMFNANRVKSGDTPQKDATVTTASDRARGTEDRLQQAFMVRRTIFSIFQYS